MPIDPAAVHRRRLGAIEAASRHEALLADPAVEADNALRYRWMLNIAHMQLGSWPQGVAPKWRIGPEAFASDGASPRFKEMASADCRAA